MSVHQCPRCELRFRGESEVRSHLVDDHDVDPETLDHHYTLRPGIHPHRDVPNAVDRDGR